MHGIKRHLQCRSKLAAAMTAFIAVIGSAGSIAHAATLPPPPVSPPPVTDYEYDAKGNPTKVIKAKGVSGFGFATTNAYDPLDRVKTSTDARNGVTQLGYDGIDQLKQVTDPRSLVTSYQRNGLGDLTQLASPDTGTANSTYDPNGNLLTRTDSRGVQATYVYDPLDRMTSAIYTKSGQAAQNYSWTYDQTGGDFGIGTKRLTTAVSPSTTTKYGYDIKGRLITVIQSVGGVVLTTRYGYDRADHVTSITYPSGRLLTIQYQDGFMTGMTLAKDAVSTAKPLITNVQWDPFGPMSSWQIQLTAGPKTIERVFDTYGRLVRYPLNGVVRDITYDAADRIVSYTHLDAATGAVTAEAQAMNQSFGYDELGRLTSIITPANSWTIGYDANGNRTGMTLNGAARNYTTATTSNRLTGIDNPVRSFTHDAAGNTLTDTGLGYTTTYGLDNRLATLTSAGVTTTYNYDAGGQRVRKVTGTSRPHFAYDPNGQLLGEYNSSGGALQEFVWLGNTLIAVLTNSSTTEPRIYYAYSDHLNTPRVIVNAAGDVRWRWIAEPFGTTAAETIPNSLENLVVNLRFPGQYFDKESGLSYNYFRDYDSTLGRYTQSDPIGLAGGLNTFSYVSGRPTQLSDQLGLCPICLIPALPFLPEATIIGGLWWSSQHDSSSRSKTGGASEEWKACPPNAGNQDPCKGLRDQLADHRRKYDEYVKNPSAGDNKGVLAAAFESNDMELYNKIINGRLKSLQGQIENFQRQLEVCERQHGKK
ncbi:RHS repeat domain-containing protein [Mitsuaria sp. 7]|uniref:RHS repeat domain-containing protein n=1 Tax=Mitsuaria sp. 7 TaxID=1658665 RepID=UPI0009ED6152|nr:RHS repeat-associated core domain-containing protein [Mitsuaria sp. 7]